MYDSPCRMWVYCCAGPVAQWGPTFGISQFDIDYQVGWQGNCICQQCGQCWGIIQAIPCVYGQVLFRFSLFFCRLIATAGLIGLPVVVPNWSTQGLLLLLLLPRHGNTTINLIKISATATTTTSSKEADTSCALMKTKRPDQPRVPQCRR